MLLDFEIPFPYHLANVVVLQLKLKDWVLLNWGYLGLLRLRLRLLSSLLTLRLRLSRLRARHLLLLRRVRCHVDALAAKDALGEGEGLFAFDPLVQGLRVRHEVVTLRLDEHLPMSGEAALVDILNGFLDGDFGTANHKLVELL